MIYADGVGVEPDSARAITLMRMACERGALKACASLGKIYGWGEGVADDDATSVPFNRWACEGSILSSCYELGIQVTNDQHRLRSARRLTTGD